MYARRFACTLALALALAAGAARAVSPLGDIPLTTNVYNAAEIDALLAGAGGGGAGAEDVSNLVARVIAEAGETAAAAEIYRIILADHQRRLDALEDADGTDALTQAQAEAIVNARCETWATNAITPAVAAYRSALQTAQDAAADYRAATMAKGFDVESDEIAATQYTSTGAVSISLDPDTVVRYYRSASASATLSISSFANAHNFPCWLLIDGYGSVTWPSGSAYAGSAYPGTAGGVFRICKLNSKIYIERVF